MSKYESLVAIKPLIQQSEDTSDLNGWLDLLLAWLPGLSREKPLRILSSELILLFPTSLVLEKLNKLYELKSKSHVNDLGLILHWIDVIMTSHPQNTDLPPHLILLQSKFLLKALKALQESHKSAAGYSRFVQTMIRRTRQSLKVMSKAQKQSFKIDDFINLVLESGVSGLVSVCQLIYVDLDSADLTIQIPDLYAKQVAELYIGVVLNAKPAEFADQIAPLLSAQLLDPLFACGFFNQDVFETLICPNLTRALLRSPFQIVSYVIPSVIQDEDLNFDSLAKSPSLVSNLSSSDPNLRKACARAFAQILERCENPAPENVVSQFKKITNSEQRALYATVLAHSKPSPNSDVPAALALQAGKEANESSINVLAEAIASVIVENVGSEPCITAFKQGLSDKRQNLRKEWICVLAENDANRAMASLHFKQELLDAFAEITSNTANVVKMSSAVFAIITIIPDSVLSSLKETELFSRRVIEHSTSDRDLKLLSNAASLALTETKELDVVLEALVHTCVAGSPQSKLESVNALNITLQRFPARPDIFSSLASCLLAKALQGLDVGKFVCTIKNVQWPLAAFVLSHTENAVPPAGGWISLCLRCQVDPNALVHDNSDAIFDQAVQLKSAQALATLAFVAPEVVVERIVELLKTLMVPEPMTTQDESILNASDDHLVQAHMPSSTKRNNNNNKPGKMSDEAWEAELRREIAEKRGELTDKQKEELAEQKKRREFLSGIRENTEFGCSILIALARDTAKGATNAPVVWIPAGVSLCLSIISKNAPGKEAVANCIRVLSSCLSDRFSSNWKQATADLLLSNKKLNVNELRRMLYMLNPSSDKRELDTPTMVYILPIFIVFLEEYSKSQSSSHASFEDTGASTEEGDAEETVLLILALLANQAKVLAQVPRGNLVGALLSLLASFASDRTAVKDCLRSVAQQVPFDDDELLMLLDLSVAAPQDFVRSAALEIIDEEVDLSGHGFSPEIWIARFGEFSEVAQDIWRESGMEIPETEFLERLVPFFNTKYLASHEALSRAYAGACLASNAVDRGFQILAERYAVLRQPPKPVFNQFGVEIKQKWIDPVLDRVAIIKTCQQLIPHFDESTILSCAAFIVDEGIVDHAEDASSNALELGKYLVSEHGAKSVDGILPLFENKNVVLYSFAAQFLPAQDPRLPDTVDRLVKAIVDGVDDTAMEISPVISASVSGLSGLAPRTDVDEKMKSLLANTISFDPQGSRLGSALAFAGLAKGLGLQSLSEYSVESAVINGVSEKKNAGVRIGAQMLVAALAYTYGTLFEPYALEFMPQVLSGLGDPQLVVRTAAAEAAKRIMANTTAYGVKLQIPLALSQLEQTAWRSKKGAVELLGSMAFLSPQQLAGSLTTIVPEIVNLLNDTHKEVRAAAQAAMKLFGDVIQNPEIKKLVPVLLKAVSNPTEFTDAALTDLLKTRFMHYIDSPSLALVIFVVQRGLRDRSANTKRKACQIVGNMSILTTSSDLIPYLPEIMPDLEVAMTDPVPQTCTVACKALGVLVEKLGEEYFPNVIPNLVERLKSNDPAAVGERWGTAQGLAEVLHGLGIKKLEEMLPEIVANCQAPETHIREGFVPMLLLLPGSFGAAITPYLSMLVAPLLSGLADSQETIREYALKAGRRIVKGYATVAIDLLLPELELGLWDPSWRVRLASVELVGDMLLQILGKGKEISHAERLKAISSSKPDETGETADSEEQEAKLAVEEQQSAESNRTSELTETSLRHLEVIGTARRDRVLASLFVCRADVVGSVRQAALDIWITLIQNTPRTVKAILPTLVYMLIKRLSDEEEELQTNAARALAELVRRVSNGLHHVLPTLLQYLPDHDAREGICLGLVELIPASSVQLLREHEQELMHIVRTCLQDNQVTVRESANRALDKLHSSLGDVSSDILPEMVDEMVKSNDEGSLAAIKEMVSSTGSNNILEVALPPLLRSTIDEFKATAISELCVTSPVSEMRLYVEDVVNCLIKTDYLHKLDAVLLKSCPENHLLTVAKRDDQLRPKVFSLMAAYYSNSKQVDMLFVSDWVVFALHGLEKDNTSVPSEELLRSLTSSEAISKSDLASLASTAYSTLSLLSSPIPALSRSAKGPAFILPIFLNGLALGSNLEKEQSALAIAEVVKRTSPPEALKPVVTQMTGPLIRIVGERAASDIKAAIIYTLNVLLQTIPQFLKPFLPQLQRTFAKNLGDPSSSIVRTRSSQALGSLIKLQTRIDPLAREVVAGVRNSEDNGIRTAYLSALHEIVCHAGMHLGEAERLSVVEVVSDADMFTTSEDLKLMSLLARIGADLVAITTDSNAAKKLTDSLLSSQSKLFACLSGNALATFAKPQALHIAPDLFQFFIENSSASSAALSEFSVRGIGKLLLISDLSNDVNSAQFEAIQSLVNILPKDIGRSEESRRLSLVVLLTVVRKFGYEILKPYWNDLVPVLFAAARDMVIPVKIAAEALFLIVFDFANRQDSVLFDEWFNTVKDSLDSRMQRSLPEYVRRVAMRAAGRAAETETENNEQDDLAEVWSLGSE